jgi:hypothetical protein
LPGLIEAFSQDSMRYLALDFVAGESLRDQLDARGAFAPDEAGPLCLQVTRAVAALHAAGVVHHDVKPDNVKISSTGLAVLLDLGSARPAHREDSLPPPASMGPLALEPITGTAGYMAPEMREMADAGMLRSHPSLDVFALGGTIYELVTGKRLSQEDIDSRNEGAIDIAVGEVASAMPTVAEAVAHALKLEPEQRCPSAQELLAELARGVPPKPATRRATLEFDVSAGIGEVEQTLVVTNAGGGRLAGVVRSNVPAVSLGRTDGGRASELSFTGNLAIVRVVAEAATAPAGEREPRGVTIHTDHGSLDVGCHFGRRVVGPARLTVRPSRATLAMTPQTVQQIMVKVRNEGLTAGRVLVRLARPNLLEVAPAEAHLFPGTEADFLIRPLLSARSGTHQTEVVFAVEHGESSAAVVVTVRVSGSPWRDISHRLFRQRN